MKKILIVIALCVSCFNPLPANSAELMGIYVAPKFIFSFVNSDFKGYSALGSDNYGNRNDSTYGGALAIGYDFKPSFNVPIRTEIEYSIYSEFKNSDSENVLGAVADVEAKLDIQTLFVNVYYDFHNSSSFTPYVGGGIGIAFVSAEAKVKSGGLNVNLDADRQSNFAWNIGAGVAYAFNDNISLDLAYRYAQFGAAKTKKYTALGLYGKAENIAAHQIMLGARFTF